MQNALSLFGVGTLPFTLLICGLSGCACISWVMGRRHRKASARFNEWCMRNPGVYIGLSPVGRALVLECIRTYENLAVIPWEMKDEIYLAHLKALLNEFPSPPGHDMSIASAFAAPEGGRSFCPHVHFGPACFQCGIIPAGDFLAACRDDR